MMLPAAITYGMGQAAAAPQIAATTAAAGGAGAAGAASMLGPAGMAAGLGLQGYQMLQDRKAQKKAQSEAQKAKQKQEVAMMTDALLGLADNLFVREASHRRRLGMLQGVANAELRR